MILIPDDLRARLLAKGAAAGESHHLPVVKLFDPAGAATWLFTEMMPDGDTLFGLCDLGFGCPELGYVRFAEALKGLSSFLLADVARNHEVAALLVGPTSPGGCGQHRVQIDFIRASHEADAGRRVQLQRQSPDFERAAESLDHSIREALRGFEASLHEGCQLGGIGVEKLRVGRGALVQSLAERGPQPAAVGEIQQFDDGRKIVEPYHEEPLTAALRPSCGQGCEPALQGRTVRQSGKLVGQCCLGLAPGFALQMVDQQSGQETRGSEEKTAQQPVLQPLHFTGRDIDRHEGAQRQTEQQRRSQSPFPTEEKGAGDDGEVSAVRVDVAGTAGLVDKEDDQRGQDRHEQECKAANEMTALIPARGEFSQHDLTPFGWRESSSMRPPPILALSSFVEYPGCVRGVATAGG